MNFNEITKLLESASLFDLWQINCFTHDLMQNEDRIRSMKYKLTIGMEISYFDNVARKFVNAIILEIRKNKVLVHNKDDHKNWLIYLVAINLDHITDIPPSFRTTGINKGEWKINDHVGWRSSKVGEELFGNIIKLNPKRALVKLANGVTWAIPYSMLFPVLEANAVHTKPTEIAVDSKTIAPS